VRITARWADGDMPFLATWGRLETHAVIDLPRRLPALRFARFDNP
jgi:hypothetical protein